MSERPIIVSSAAQGNAPAGDSHPSTSTSGGQPATALKRLVLVLIVLVLCFSKPLYDLVRLALKSDLYSHVLLIPFVSIYLMWLRRDAFAFPSTPAVKLAALPLAVGLLSLAGYWWSRGGQPPMAVNDYLALTVFSFVCLVVAACILLLGRRTVRALAFPLAFLLFMVPFPTMVENGVEIFFQHTSAVAAHWLFKLSGMPVLVDGLEFQLPGFQMRVAQECSGIRSSLVLFITSLIAGKLLLRSPWKRAVFTFAVIPLGILRNGFRIWTIGQLCVRIGPEMIDSPIHRRGGPYFFLLSLVPFFLLLFFLRRNEFARHREPSTKS